MQARFKSIGNLQCRKGPDLHIPRYQAHLKLVGVKHTGGDM
jgi:hypothetical protein